MGKRVRRVRQTEGGRGARDAEAALLVANADWRRETLREDGDAYPDALHGPRRGDRRNRVRV